MQASGHKRVLNFDEFFSQENEPSSMAMPSEPGEMDQFKMTHSAEVNEPEMEEPTDMDLTMMDEPEQEETDMDEPESDLIEENKSL